ncbi:MAG: helix-turn-helix transcriptional regulator [Burkholderiales bacterium]|nr:helix-turn-helix transcriptional regulator [Burkholderiales bacterium]
MNTDSVAPKGGALPVEESSARYLEQAAGLGTGSEVKNARKDIRAAYMKDFGMRARMARGVMDVADAAAKIGVHRNTVWNIERGETLPDAFELQLMAQVYRVPVDVLLGAAGGRQSPIGGPVKSASAVEMGAYIYVPLFDVHVSAGPGAFQGVEHVTAMRPFDAGFIRAELNISHNELAMCGVIGSSALPDLKPKDTIMLDLRDHAVMSEGLHVVRLDDALMLKKLQRLPGKVLRVSSANDSYPPFEISGFEDSQRDFQVIGRVRWAGVTFH